MKHFAFLTQFRRLLPALLIFGIVVIGLVAFSLSHAATPFISAESESGTLIAPASIISDTTASGSKAVQFGASTSTPLYGWLRNATNTGLASVGLTCDGLPVYTGANPVPAGSRISNVRFTGGVDLSKGNIVIDKSCFKPSNTSIGQGSPVVTTTDFNCSGPGGACLPTPAKVTIQNSEWDGTQLDDFHAAWATCFWGIADITNTYCHHFGGGPALYNSGTQLSATFDSNYVTDMISWGDASTNGNHSDGMTVRDFNVDTNPSRKAIFSNNRIEEHTANATAAMFIQDTNSEGIGNVYMTGNLFDGGGYSLEMDHQAPTELHITNNRFIKNGFGYCATSFTITEFSQNYAFTNTPPDYKGALVTC
jgi:hypothetical protein